MSEIPAEVIEAGNRFADLFGDGRQGYAAFDIAVLAIMEDRQRDQWQDISTAPKGEIILVYGEAAGEISGPRSGAVVFPAQFTEGTDYPGYHWLVPETDIAAMWIKATHWQPLPAAPKGE